MKFNDLINNSENWIKEKFEIINEQITETKKEVNDKINLYLESDAYEEDLDEMLKSIKSKFYKDVCYNHVNERKERIELKLAQVCKKSAIAVGEGAIAGAASTATIIPEPNIVLTTAGAGASAQVVLISTSASMIIIRRSLNGHKNRSYSPT